MTASRRPVEVKSGSMVPVLAVFLATRIALIWLAAGYASILPDTTNPSGDVITYERQAREMLSGRAPYSQVSFEYPPGVLPFLVLPAVASPRGDYRAAFIAMMAAVDVGGLVILSFISRRWRSSTGMWLWTLGIPLLGALPYLRLDLIPAVATIWAVERLSAGSWSGMGGWLGFGAAAKIYPGTIAPAAILVSARRKATLVSAAGVGALAIAPFLTVFPDLVQNVLGYHGSRGIQVESTWGAAALGILGSRRAPVSYRFSAFEVVFKVANQVKAGALAVSVAAVVATTWVVCARVDSESRPALATGLFGILSTVTAVGTVFSPQYIIWLLALGATVLCWEGGPARGAVLTLLPVALLTQLIYPLNYDALLDGAPLAILAVLVRNVLVLALGLLALASLRSRRAEAPLAPAATPS